MNEFLDQDLLEQDYRKACYRMAEALLMVSEPSYRLLSQDNKKLYAERIISYYMEDEFNYEPRHKKDD